MNKRIIARRKAAGLSERDLEKVTGISQPTLSRIENGSRMPKLTEILALAKALGTTYGDITGTSKTIDSLEYAARVDHDSLESAEAYEELKERAAFFFEIDNYLDECGISR